MAMSHFLKKVGGAPLRRMSTNHRPPSRFRFADKPDLDKKLKPSDCVLLIFPLTALALGVWQTKRRTWKLGLMEKLQERTSAPPLSLPETSDEIEELEYRKVRVLGRFDHSRESYLGPRSLITNGAEGESMGIIGKSDGSGWHVVTPFKLADSDRTILVNRGWVAKAKKDPKTRLDAQQEGDVQLVGVVRNTETRPQFSPPNRARGDVGSLWMYRDIPAMASSLGTDPVFIDADADSTIKGGPVGGQTKVTLRNDHFSYMLTWYSLSGATFYLWCKRFLAL